MSEAEANVQYHLAELRVLSDASHPNRSVPTLLPTEEAVLDIGCGIGQLLVAPELHAAVVRCGIDVDSAAVAYGLREFPALDLRVAKAECLPFPDASFDLLLSRVALPYTNVPVALREIYRVLKPGGRLWAMLHPWEIERRRLGAALRALHLRTIIDSGYVHTNSLLLSLAQRSLPRPWSGLHESFQTSGGARRCLERAGFEVLIIDRSEHFRVESRKPAASRP